ncbi:hypothetical protein FRC02_002545 [Tulasnella sp. 418]|nr:hypothetical protein FRC02_002545 [Tulasnella sp. 418]
MAVPLPQQPSGTCSSSRNWGNILQKIKIVACASGSSLYKMSSPPFGDDTPTDDRAMSRGGPGDSATSMQALQRRVLVEFYLEEMLRNLLVGENDIEQDFGDSSDDEDADESTIEDEFGELASLAHAKLNVYMQHGGSSRLNEAIELFEEAMDLQAIGHPAWLMTVDNFGHCLFLSYKQSGSLWHLQRAMWCHRKALTLRPLGDPERPSSLNNLAICTQARYEHLGSAEDLAEAIKCHKEALLLYPPGQTDRATTLTNLEAFEDAIVYYREALALRPPGHPQRSRALSNLAHHLHTRSEQQLERKDLEEAIQLYREALLLRPPGHPERSETLSGLATCIAEQKKEDGSIQGLQDAAQYYREALVLRPLGHPARSMSLHNLASFLRTRWERHGINEDLEESIQLFQEVLRILPPSHPRRPSSLHHVAVSLLERYKQRHDPEDLGIAIKYIHESISIIPPNHPSLCFKLASLASAYADYGDVLKESYNVDDFPSIFRRACNLKTASLYDRFRTSQMWVQRQSGPAGLEAYQACLELADLFLLIKPSVTARRALLSSIPSNLVLDAVASAIEAGDLRRAVEFLEQGRTLLWSQISRYRASLDTLQEIEPELAKEFWRLSQLLETSATTKITEERSTKSMEAEASKYRRIAEDWDATVERIRGINGFEDFLRHPKFSKLQQSSKHGPVIVINLSPRHSDAIIIQYNKDPTLVPLPHVNISDVVTTTNNFIMAVRADGSRTVKVKAILRTLWDDIVEPIVEELRNLKVAFGSRIWWCPTYALSLLPIHAAGPYRRGKLNLFDMYISSYTSTLSALARSIDGGAKAPHTTIPRLLVVAQPTTPDLAEIPYVREEVEKIKDSVPSANVLLDTEGTRAAVLKNLQTHNWVHFTCHGSQKHENPFDSCFYLYDKPLTLLDIIQARIPDAQYAFLSACHSAAGDVKRPDENVQLAASLQFSGFRSVIGTMYAMADVDGPIVAEEVYSHLFRHSETGKEVPYNCLVDYKDAASALHIATKALRDRGVPLERWINFVHIGA